MEASNSEFDLFSEIDNICEPDYKFIEELNIKSASEIMTDFGLPSQDISGNDLDILTLGMDNSFISANDIFLNSCFSSDVSNNISLTYDEKRIMPVSFPAQATELPQQAELAPLTPPNSARNSELIDIDLKLESNKSDPAICNKSEYLLSCISTDSEHEDSDSVGSESSDTEDFKPDGNMVAPLILPKVGSTLVRIPQVNVNSLGPATITKIGTADVVKETAKSLSPSKKREASPEYVTPKALLRKRFKAIPKNAIDSTSAGNNKTCLPTLALPTKLKNKIIASTATTSSISTCTINNEHTTQLIEKEANKLSKTKRKPVKQIEKVKNLPFHSKVKKDMRSIRSTKSSLKNRRNINFKAYELDQFNDPELERCRKNAINAKKNRELKKAKMAELEKSIQDVSEERNKLAGVNQVLVKEKNHLLNEVEYLKNIIKNQNHFKEILNKMGSNATDIEIDSPKLSEMSVNAITRGS